MATDQQIVDTFQNTVANTAEVAFTSPITSTGTLITAIVASNGTAVDRSYQAYIVSSGGSATNPQVPARTVVKKKTDVPPELAGQVIPAGGTLQFESSAISSITFTVSGRNLT